jgi:TfoX/Sxy family transcriptional regulator of competence genes
MKSKWQKASPELTAYFEESTAGIDCEHRIMFGYPCCFLNGNMFTGVFRDVIIVRLSKPDRVQTLKRLKGSRQFEPLPGRVMKEYLSLPEKIYRDEKIFEDLLMKSIKYCATLPRKEKKKKKVKN